MKMLGLIGGMSWESTVPYYRIINETIREQLGGQHSARLVLYSVDFHEIEAMQRDGAWDTAAAALTRAATVLEGAGAELLVLCTNTMHKVAPAIEAAATIPLLHIADVTAQAIVHAHVSRVALLGTRFTMEQDFYRQRLCRDHAIDVLAPATAERQRIHDIIYDELCQGRVLPASRTEFQRIIAGLVEGGAEGIILGCTEISMLVTPNDCAVPLFDTTAIHARAAAIAALVEGDSA